MKITPSPAFLTAQAMPADTARHARGAFAEAYGQQAGIETRRAGERAPERSETAQSVKRPGSAPADRLHAERPREDVPRSDAAAFRREAPMAEARPAFQRPGSLVDLTV